MVSINMPIFFIFPSRGMEPTTRTEAPVMLPDDPASNYLPLPVSSIRTSTFVIVSKRTTWSFPTAFTW